MKLRTLITRSVLVLTAALPTSYANAALFDFDVIWDGTDFSLDSGSDAVLGAVLEDGDSFNYNLSAEGSGFWEVDAANDYFPFMAFATDEVAVRSGTYSLDLRLGGVSQFALAPAAIGNSFVHIGTNSVSLVAGLMFDELVLDYTLISAVDETSGDPVNTTLAAYQIGGFVPGGFTSGISYNASFEPPAEVPAPATLALFGLGLAGLGYSFRKNT